MGRGCATTALHGCGILAHAVVSLHMNDRGGGGGGVGVEEVCGRCGFFVRQQFLYMVGNLCT